MSDYSQISRDFNSSSLEFLFTELDVAFTFLEVARTTHDSDTARRNHSNARLAYETVIGFMPRLHLTEAELEALQTKLGVLKQSLCAAGMNL